MICEKMNIKSIMSNVKAQMSKIIITVLDSVRSLTFIEEELLCIFYDSSGVEYKNLHV